MKTLEELRAIVTAKTELNLMYEVETNLDSEGGVYFNELSEAYECLKNTLNEQTDTDYFECEDFEKVDYVQILLHFVDDDDREIVKLVAYERKSGTEFVELDNAE